MINIPPTHTHTQTQIIANKHESWAIKGHEFHNQEDIVPFIKGRLLVGLLGVYY